MIVGFPGETDADFEDTLTLTVGRAVPQHVLVQVLAAAEHAGGRSGCPTTSPEADKTTRIVALQALQREIQTAARARRRRRTVDVLVDAASRRRETEVSGRTTTNIVVNLPGPGARIGRTVAVRIERAGRHSVGAGLRPVAPPRLRRELTGPHGR